MLNKDVNNNGLDKKKSFSFADLPSSILEIILYLLVLKDNIRASAVCKAWREAAEFVRVVGRHPWIISLPKKSDLINLIDPLHRKKYTLNCPELARTKICYSKDGWLLMRRTGRASMFFFNPFTRELISLPTCQFWYFNAFAFSSAPTSGTCIVIALQLRSRQISIFYPGATQWTYKNFSCPRELFGRNGYTNIVYANGHFYCFNSRGVLLDFDPASGTVTFQVWDDYRYPYFHNNEGISHRRVIYLMEQKGELFVMYTCGTEPPVVYKLVSSKWEEMNGQTLEGLTIFASLYSSETRVDVPGIGSSVNFTKFSLRAKKCLSYSLDEGRYYYPRKKLPIPKKPLHSSLHCPRRSIWIEPPSQIV